MAPSTRSGIPPEPPSTDEALDRPASASAVADGWQDPLLNRDVGEQGANALLLASHQGLGGWPVFADAPDVFSELLSFLRQIERTVPVEIDHRQLRDS